MTKTPVKKHPGTEVIDKFVLRNGSKISIYHNHYSSLLGYSETDSDNKPGRSDMQRFPEVFQEDLDEYISKTRKLFESEIV